MSSETSWYISISSRTWLFAFAQVRVVPTASKMGHKLDVGKTYRYFFISHFDLMQDFPFPSQTRHYPLVSWWTSPGAPTSHSRTDDRDVLAWLVWKQTSAQGTSLWDAGDPHTGWGSGNSCEHCKHSCKPGALITAFIPSSWWERALCHVPTHPGVGQELLLARCWRTQSLFVDLPLPTEAQDDTMENKRLSNGYFITSCKIRSYFLNRE